MKLCKMTVVLIFYVIILMSKEKSVMVKKLFGILGP